MAELYSDTLRPTTRHSDLKESPLQRETESMHEFQVEFAAASEGGGQMSLAEDIAQSRKHEMVIYLDSMTELYSESLRDNERIYDLAAGLTDNFRDINGSAIVADSRIIKTLRYAVAPSISQMKLGQIVGLNSVSSLEARRISPRSRAGATLASVADQIANFAQQNLDVGRFAWLQEPSLDTPLSKSYARRWTCAVAADQNVQTAYRRRRRAKQETAIASELKKLGYDSAPTRTGTITSVKQMQPGTFVAETKVQGRTIQKADVVFRSRRTSRLVLIEAKAVGVLLDATKRVKECSDKASDWRASETLGDPEIVAVIAGFFSQQNIANLMSSGVAIVWEHDLSELGRYA